MNASDQRLLEAMTEATINDRPMGVNVSDGDIYIDNQSGLRRSGGARTLNAGSLVAHQDTKLALLITGQPAPAAPSAVSVDNQARLVADGDAQPDEPDRSLANGHVVAKVDTKLALIITGAQEQTPEPVSVSLDRNGQMVTHDASTEIAAPGASIPNGRITAAMGTKLA